MQLLSDTLPFDIDKTIFVLNSIVYLSFIQHCFLKFASYYVAVKWHIAIWYR